MTISPPPLASKQLQDPNGHIIARLQTITPTKYNIGDVYRELHYIRSAGAGVVVSDLDPVDLPFSGHACRMAIQPPGAFLPREGWLNGDCDSQVNTVQFR